MVFHQGYGLFFCSTVQLAWWVTEAHHRAEEAPKGKAWDGLWREARSRQDPLEKYGHRASRMSKYYWIIFGILFFLNHLDRFDETSSRGLHFCEWLWGMNCSWHWSFLVFASVSDPKDGPNASHRVACWGQKWLDTWAAFNDPKSPHLQK